MFCSKCGTTNDDAFKFCSSCGASLAPAELKRKSWTAIDKLCSMKGSETYKHVVLKPIFLASRGFEAIKRAIGIDNVSQLNRKSWKLVPLIPEYLESEHSIYVNAINEAINNPKIRNIALSGNFGVGKSSILQKIAEQHKERVVELSLSTLAPIEEPSLDDSVPKQATTPTNRIQQEIVKQLLYREKPHKTPGSRFQRIERFRWPRELSIAFLAGIAIAVIFFLLIGQKELRRNLHR